MSIPRWVIIIVPNFILVGAFVYLFMRPEVSILYVPRWADIAATVIFYTFIGYNLGLLVWLVMRICQRRTKPRGDDAQ